MAFVVHKTKKEYIEFLDYHRQDAVYVYEAEYDVSDDLFPCLASWFIVPSDNLFGYDEELVIDILSKTHVELLFKEIE